MTITAAPPSILIVEDEPHIRGILAMALADDGYDVVGAQDAPAAVAAIRERPPHLILLDLMLPGMSGQEFLAMYHDLPAPHAPVIVVTAAGLGAQQTAEHLGAAAVIAKPFDLDKLLDLIALHLRRELGA